MSGGEIAALVAAGAFAMLALVACIPIYRLRHTVDAATKMISNLDGQATPLITNVNASVEGINTALEQVHTTLDGVNHQLVRVDMITAHAANVTGNVANLSAIVTNAVASPLVKAASLAYGVRKATNNRRRADQEAEVRAAIKERQEAEKAVRRDRRRAGRAH